MRNSTIVGVGNQTSGTIVNWATTFENTILEALKDPPLVCGPKITSLGHNVVFGDRYHCVALLPSDVTDDPGLGAFIDPGRPGTAHFPLLATSPAIDAGDNAACDAPDQLGLERPLDGNGDGVRVCDIGAVESIPW